MSHNRYSNSRGGARQASAPSGRFTPAPQPGPGSARRSKGISSQELFGRVPFSYGSDPRYFGTGVPGYTSGPGFTGGYYGYGDEPPQIPTELEREYASDVSGSAWHRSGYGPGEYAPGATAGEAPPRHVYRYPPGPKGYRRSDERIREDICDRLMRSADHIDSSEVTVEVAEAKVILEGSVPARRMKHAIEDLADSCLGVKDVENRIRVHSAAPG